jgi:ribonuclease BN (tRNA processing enzyme)
MSFIKRIQILSIALCCLAFATSVLADEGHHNYSTLAADRVQGDLSVMVLGSGGPLATTSGRASAGYLIFVDGVAKILMDCGGGTYLRIGQSGASIKDVDTILISHMHIDHMGDLDAIVKDMYFQNRVANISTSPINYPDGRTEPFNVYGPGGNPATFQAVLNLDPPLVVVNPDVDGNPWPDLLDTMTKQYPSTSEFVNDMFNINTGMDRYLHIFSQMISAGVFGYSVTDVPPVWNNPLTVDDLASHVIYNQDGLVITAVGVNHGPAPALAFRIDYKGKSIVYSGDTSSDTIGKHMETLAHDADLLIYDTSITDTLPASADNDRMFFTLHTTPSRMGEVAAAAGAKKLVLSHLTPNTEPRIPEVSSLIRAKGYTGVISVANDLKVYNLMDDPYGHH